ncbi:hypothetical protein Acr_08g0001700 [Actinidia rufa]|uniref:Uncharacterized protein n=1 Tax=Actinidia rufa TaxID=165716 RepID=A0A7J0EZB3_9ERIC|nr:hypothetical protein Acr_08g0001700 [Actinidia rufa]
MMPVEPKFAGTIDSDLLKDFLDVPRFQMCLLCFFLFPPEAVIKRRVLISLPISKRPYFNEDRAKETLDDLIEMGFVEPVYQKCSLVPDSGKMRPLVRSAFSNISMRYVNSSKYNTGGITELQSCLINFGEAIIDGELFEKSTHVNSLYLGRWQSSATHHIEVEEPKLSMG